ncbi:MAG: LysM peptidoglycan-binding domain-containing M23 family metallopeptidase [Candidatus Omnitrophica bacterium]|nr:LysM peptidoglycan-binding domain-containing M23 family metallopeptidase [Candidatus Omnitrophota bacterium]
MVKKGETLWRISRTYNINLDDLARFNRITDTCSIEINQKIFIPDSLRTVPRNEQPALGATTDFIWPYKGPLASCYNQLNQNVRNQGIDIIARVGSSVNAAAGGNVIFTSENMRGYGKTIIIQHPGNFITTYTNSQENLVKTGDYVKQGQTIAKAGSSGRTSRCIVHFELRKNNRPQNPLLYLP